MITLLEIGIIIGVVLLSYLIIRKLTPPINWYLEMYKHQTYIVHTTDEKLIGKKTKEKIGGRNGLHITTYYKRKPELVQRMDTYFKKNPDVVPVTAEQHVKTMNKIMAELNKE